MLPEASPFCRMARDLNFLELSEITGEIRAAALRLPNPFGNPAVAVGHPIIQIEGGNGTEAFVVIAFLAESFLEVLFEVVELLELIGGRGLLFAGLRAEELLVAGIDQRADLAPHHDSCAMDRPDDAAIVLNIDPVGAPACAHDTAGQRIYGKTGLADAVHALIECGV